MTLELLYFEKFEEWRQETAALLSLILTEAQKQNISVNYEQLQNTDYVRELICILKNNQMYNDLDRIIEDEAYRNNL